MTTIDQLLAQRDARRGKKAGDKHAAHARAEHSRFIAKHFVLYDHLRAHLFHPHQHPIVAFSQQENHLPEYLHQLGWIKPAGNQRWRVSNDDDIRVYLSSSTLPARKWLIPLETDFKAQTTNWVFPDQTGSVVLTPMQQIATSGRG